MASVKLELREVTMDWGDGPLLARVNLRVFEGESVVLVGPSGAGKTTLLKLFAGLLNPTRGEAFFDGEPAHAVSQASRLEMGMLFQKNALFDSLTVAENVAFPLRETAALSQDEIAARVHESLDRVGLTPARDLKPSEISGGMQKRLGIARALALEPHVVLYDDPTAGLDPLTSRKITELIADLKTRTSATLVTVTNDMARAFQLADRLVMVVDGELIDTGSEAETLAHPDPRVRQFIRGTLDGPLTDRLA